MTEKLKPTTTLAEQMEALRQRLGVPAHPRPPEDAPTPPRHPCDTDRDDEQRNEESER